jgi:hypothetical protein
MSILNLKKLKKIIYLIIIKYIIFTVTIKMAISEKIVKKVMALVLDAELQYCEKSGMLFVSHEDKCHFIVSVIGLLHNAGFVTFTPKGLSFLEQVEDSHSMAEIRNIIQNNGGELFLRKFEIIFTYVFSYIEVSQDSKRFRKDISDDIARIILDFGHILKQEYNDVNKFVSNDSGWMGITMLGEQLSD